MCNLINHTQIRGEGGEIGGEYEIVSIVSRFSPGIENDRVKRNGTTEPVWPDQTLKHKRGRTMEKNIYFLAALEQDW